MNQWNRYTPDGVQDTLFAECRLKREYEARIMGEFYSCGYFEIETPLYEYYDVFDGVEGIRQEECFKFFDREGRILTLRPDLTTPAARVAATKFEEKDFPLKLSYLGNAFRYEDVQKGGRQREFTQAGIELFGDSSSEADAEIIIMAIKALSAAGLTEFKIDVGQTQFFQGILLEEELDGESENKIRACINAKDTFLLKEILEKTKLSTLAKERLIRLPELFGDISLVEKLLLEDWNQLARTALLNVKEVYEIVKDYGYEDYLTVDLGLLQALNYYTGIVFKGFTYGVGFPVCGGGRYDTLTTRFGKNIAATGCAIAVSRLVSLGISQATTPSCHGTVFFEGADRKNAIFIAQSLRNQGMSVELRPGCSKEEAFCYLKKKGIENGIFVTGESVLIHNTIEGTTINTSLSELLSEEEQE